MRALGDSLADCADAGVGGSDSGGGSHSDGPRYDISDQQLFERVVALEETVSELRGAVQALKAIEDTIAAAPRLIPVWVRWPVAGAFAQEECGTFLPAHGRSDIWPGCKRQSFAASAA